jgi:selenocysteine lyase/cysteine desulfurase
MASPEPDPTWPVSGSGPDTTVDVQPSRAPAALVGEGLAVPCLDGCGRPYLSFDAAASTSALPAVAARVADFLPWYSSVHRGAGYKSQLASAAYDDAHAALLEFAGRAGTDDVAIICRNTTEAINHLAYRLRLHPEDVVVTTVAEHHANLLPWARVATRRFVECGPDGTFDVAAVCAALDAPPAPRLLAITGASNVTGWVPPIDTIVARAHERGIPVAVDAAQLAPHRPLPAHADFLAFSGHKMYAPFGAGVLVGPRTAFADGDPFLVGGGAVELVTLDDAVWKDPPEREEAGSPNVLGAVAFATAARELRQIGRQRIRAHDDELADRLRRELRSIEGVRVIGPGPDADLLPIATFTVDGVPPALVAARLSAEFAIGVRHGRFCAHPYVARLLRSDPRSALRAVRASAGISTTTADVARLVEAVETVTRTPPPTEYRRDPRSGALWPVGLPRPHP